MSIDIQQFDFLDFGASKGASIEFAQQHLFGERGLGIDIDPVRVETMKRAGYDCMVGDLADLDLPAKCVRFVKMSHILEHLPDLDIVAKAIDTGRRCATDFLLITGPFFDEDIYLNSKGFKLPWSDYTGHTCHLTVAQLTDILRKLKLANYELYLRRPLADSHHEQILPLRAPRDTHLYDPKKHSRKKLVTFDRYIWTDFVCYVRLGKVAQWREITSAYKNQVPYLIREGNSHYASPDRVIEKFLELDKQNQQQEQTISKLKADYRQLSGSVSTLREQLTAITSSRSWRAARLLQKGARGVKHPVSILKNRNN